MVSILKEFGVILIILFIAALAYYLYLMPTDPFIWLMIGAVLGLVLAAGIIIIAEDRKK